MLILLPPSEGKAEAGHGPPADMASLSFPALTRTRERVLTALVKLCNGREARARDVLGLTPGQADAIARNREIREAATLPARELYTGVLYDNLGLASLDPERADRTLLIFSGLWGAVRTGDWLPPYRLAMNVKLPRLGPLAPLWRPALGKALKGDHGLIVDMRSAPYAAAWKPAATPVRVFQERIVDGAPKRSVVSHMAKATRGLVARSLIESAAQPRTPLELAKTLGDLGYTAEHNANAVDVILT